MHIEQEVDRSITAGRAAGGAEIFYANMNQWQQERIKFLSIMLFCWPTLVLNYAACLTQTSLQQFSIDFYYLLAILGYSVNVIEKLVHFSPTVIAALKMVYAIQFAMLSIELSLIHI